MNNDHYARYSTSLHCNGSELPFPQLPESEFQNIVMIELFQNTITISYL